MGRGQNSSSSTLSAVSRRSEQTATAEPVSEVNSLEELSNPGYSLLARLATSPNPGQMHSLDNPREERAANELASAGLIQTGTDKGRSWVSLSDTGNKLWEEDGLGDLDEDFEDLI